MSEEKVTVTQNSYLEKVIMENDITFECLVIRPGSIKEVSWSDPLYSFKLMELDLFESVSTNSDNFMEVLATKLNVNNFTVKNMSVKTEIIGDIPNYVYDLLYIDLEKNPEYHTEENFNEMASLININGDKIYSNAIIFKNHIESFSDSMNLVTVTKKDLAELLHSRVHTKVVTWDDTWKEATVVGDLTKFASEFFEDGSIVKIEFPFLMHNINIWYTTFSYGSDPCGKLVNKKIDKCLWFTMKSEEFRGSLTLDEVKKIISLSEKLENYNTPAIYAEEKIDNMGRKIIYNKYKVLDLVFKNEFNNKKI